MRYRFLLVAVLALAVGSCEDEEIPTAPPVTKKAKTGTPASASVTLTRVDTTKASSICRATVRARGRARLQFDRTPTDDLVRRKAVAYDVLVADACK